MREYSDQWGLQYVLLHSLLGVSNLKQAVSNAVNFNFTIKDATLISECIVRLKIEQRYDCGTLFVLLCVMRTYFWTIYTEMAVTVSVRFTEMPFVIVTYSTFAGAHHPERATSIQRLCNGVFTSRFIFRQALPAN